MTPEELTTLLEGQPLNHRLDVRTLVQDQVRQLDEAAILELFWRFLPHLDAAEVSDYLYMTRS